MTHIGTWRVHKVPEMFVPTFFISIATIFPSLGMLIIRNCTKKNLSGVRKIILIAITIAFYVINGILIHSSTRNISLNKKDTIHIGWYVAANLNWCSVIILNINSIYIYCYEVLHKYEYKTLIVPQKNSISLGSTISLSKTQEAAKENSTKARSKSNLDKRSTGNRKPKSRAVALPKSGNMSSFVNTPKRK